MLILVDSKDHNYSTDFNVELIRPIKFKKVKVKTILIPNSSYVINSTNNYIYFTDDGTTYTAIIPIGFYTLLSLCSAIQTAMRAVGSQDYIVTFSALTFKVTISATTAFSLLFSTHTNNPSNVIGFNSSDYTGSNTYTSPNVSNLSIDYFLFKSKELIGTSGYNYIRNLYPDNSIMMIPNTVNFGMINIVNDSFEQYIEFPSSKEMRTFDVKLTNSNGTALDLNGRSFSILLELF